MATSRRTIFVTALGALTALALLGCERREAGAGERVVLYCSVDGDVARPILDAFTKRTGVVVDAVFDTEATKTTGLVNRLLSEKESPRADVWWSSEPFGTIRLARAGVLAPFTSEHNRAEFFTGSGWEVSNWPARLRGSDRTWYGFAERTRVLVWNTERVKPEAVPKTLHEFVDPRWKGRVAIARPQFGTTRGHMAAIATFWGEAALEGWLKAMRDNDVRLVDGNASVVRAVASGEAWIGLTDNDDVVSGRANGWKVADAPILDVLDASVAGASEKRIECFRVSVPGTVAIIKGGPHERAARLLANHLLSIETEEALSRSVFQTRRLRRSADRPGAGSDDIGCYAAPCPEVSLESVADHVEPAMRVCEKIWH